MTFFLNETTNEKIHHKPRFTTLKNRDAYNPPNAYKSQIKTLRYLQTLKSLCHDMQTNMAITYVNKIVINKDTNFQEISLLCDYIKTNDRSTLLKKVETKIDNHIRTTSEKLNYEYKMAKYLV